MLLRDDGAGAVGDVGEGAAVDEGGGAFGGLDEVGLDGLGEQGHHGADGAEVGGADGLAGAGAADDDGGEAAAEVFAALGEREDGHDLAGGGDDEAGGTVAAVACFLSGATTPVTMWRRARSFMSRVRGQVMALGSRSSSLPWKRWESMRAASRLWAEVMAWKSPWKWRLIFSAGSIWELPPPAAPPFMPKTGPSEGSREVMMARLPMRSRPCTRPMEVTVLPSPEAVGWSR